MATSSQSPQLATAFPTADTSVVRSTCCRRQRTATTPPCVVVIRETEQAEVVLAGSQGTAAAFLYSVGPRRSSALRTFRQRFAGVQFLRFLHSARRDAATTLRFSVAGPLFRIPPKDVTNLWGVLKVILLKPKTIGCFSYRPTNIIRSRKADGTTLLSV